MLSVTFYISVKFPLPKIDPRFRHCSFLATGVAMPEATVHEDYRLVLGQNDIWRAGQSLTMQAKSQTKAVEEAAHFCFGPGVRPAHGTHDPAPVSTDETFG